MENAPIGSAPKESTFCGLPVLRMVSARLAFGTVLLLVSLFSGCAARGPRSMSAVPECDLTDADSSRLVNAWQRQLSEYVTRFGNGDPAVLSRLPELRSTGTLRPARITFGALDVETTVRERDGFDVQGLLLGKHSDAAGSWYVFIAGIIERRGYRTASIAGVRLAAMSIRGGALVWETGASDAQALALYRHSVDVAAPLRFPADTDRFEMVSCPAGVCVEESGSGAHWTLQLSSGATAVQAMH